MSPLACQPAFSEDRRADRCVRAGAWAAVLALASALIWLGLSYGPAMADPLAVPTDADLSSARSDR